MSKMITVRLSADRAERLDALVASGVYATRAAAVTAALDSLLRQIEKARIDEAIVSGYRRRPPSEGDEAYALASTLESIRQEPW
jgi:Arc/MetJ-type ribon-helix-helix transcriptional regulator